MDWVSPLGGNWAYMVKNQKLIGQFIRTNEMKPSVIGQVGVGMGAPAKALIDLGIRGGMKVPHLHFNDRIYLMNPAQWAQFSANIIADCKAKPANVKQVSFDQGMLLGSAAQLAVGG